MSSVKYQVKSRLQPTVAPLTAAVGLALSATTLQAAVITVDTLADGSLPGQCTLRDAVLAAYTDAPVAGCPAGAGPDVIQFEGGLTGTITLTAGAIVNHSDVTLNGPGAGQLTISGNGTDRVFFNNAPLRIDRLTLAGGAINETTGGAAIVTSGGPLHLSNCAIIDNYSGPSAYGGAVTVVNAQATVDQCHFDNNQVVGGPLLGGGGSAAYGGAILAVNSLLLVNDSTFTNNQSGYQGGAIALVNSYSDILSSTISNNNALYGGGISAAGFSAAYVAESVLTFNEAAAGGAIIAGSSSEILLYHSEITSNLAQIYGGGIQIGVGGPSPLGYSPFYGHEPRGGPNFSLLGPAELTDVGSQISSNQSYNYGGGLVAKYDSLVELSDTQVNSNSALPPLPLSSSNEQQGLSESIVTHSMIAGRGGADSGNGGGLLVRSGAAVYGFNVQLADNHANSLGGGGLADSEGSLYLIESTIENNTAFVGAGLLAGFIDPSVEGLISPDAEPLARRGSSNGVVVVEYSLISGNSASYLGGGLASIFGGTASAKYSELAFNQAPRGGGSGSYGAALFIAGSDIHDNTASYLGGGMSAEANCQIVVVNSTISGNSAMTAGGLVTQNCGATIKYSTINENTAAVIGGLAAIGDGFTTLSVLNTTITGNSANQVGGLHAANIEMNFVTLSHNTATGAPLPLSHSGHRMARGMSENPGGASIIASAGQTALSNSIFAGNTNPDANIDLSVAIDGGVATLDYSLIQVPGSGLPVGTGNLFAVDPQLGPLADNGGQTLTRALPVSSPAVDTADPATTVSHDQRNEPYPRVFGGRADMGAFEFIIDELFSDRFEQP
jgi:hypothetical protein